MTMSRLVGAAVVAGVALVGAVDAQSPALVLKIATIVPEGSPWHDVLLDLAQRWRTVSQGAVQVKIYAGVPRATRRSSCGRFASGCCRASASRRTASGPLRPTSARSRCRCCSILYDELDYVRDRISPRLVQSLGDRGFVVLHWGDGGWVRFFTTRPARSIDDVRRMRTFTWAGNPLGEELWKQAGFHPVPLAPTDILTSLQAGLIDGCPVPPTAALAYQWFGISKYMIDVKIAPIVGATVISRTAWERIDPALRPALLKESEAVGARLRSRIRALDGEAIAAMRTRGLQVVTPTPELQQQWRDAATAIYPKVRGELIPAAQFDEVVRLVREQRAREAR